MYDVHLQSYLHAEHLDILEFQKYHNIDNIHVAYSQYIVSCNHDSFRERNAKTYFEDNKYIL